MTDGVLFIFGLVITLIVVAGAGGFLWAAIEDGKAQARQDDHSAGR